MREMKTETVDNKKKKWKKSSVLSFPATNITFFSQLVFYFVFSLTLKTLFYNFFFYCRRLHPIPAFQAFHEWWYFIRINTFQHLIQSFFLFFHFLRLKWFVICIFKSLYFFVNNIPFRKCIWVFQRANNSIILKKSQLKWIWNRFSLIILILYIFAWNLKFFFAL